MTTMILNKITAPFTRSLLIITLASIHAFGASPTLQEPKKEADGSGYNFLSSHDEIVAKAKKEGKLRVKTGLEPTNFKPLIDGFRQKYPFITDVQVEEITGQDAFQKFVLELKSGQAKQWDVIHMPPDFGKEYMPYLMKSDILAMAKRGGLKIDPRMIHSGEKNIVGVTSAIRVVAYNKKLISEDQVPSKWEDFLKPDFKGKKFVLDLRPRPLAGLVPAWGLERTLDFARKLAAQQPIWWGSSATKVNTAIAAGEYSLYLGPNFSIVKRAMGKDPTASLSYKVVEPIPTGIIEHASGIPNTADHPHAALLWLEFLASPEAQEIIDKYEPLRASVFTAGSVTEQMTRGKELSLTDWGHFTKFQEYEEKVFAAYGFPRADK